jgi:hypothetical protein
MTSDAKSPETSATVAWMRSLIVALAVASCGPPTIPITEKTTVPTNMQEEDRTTGVTGDKKKPSAAIDGWRAGPAGFPVPQDADNGTQVAGGDTTFTIPRRIETVHTELKKHLVSQGYALDADQKYMGGYRMMIKNREGKLFAVTVTENGDKSTVMTIGAK